MSECSSYDITNMRNGFSEWSLCHINEMGDGTYLIAIYVILIKWEIVYVWKHIVWCY